MSDVIVISVTCLSVVASLFGFYHGVRPLMRSNDFEDRRSARMQLIICLACGVALAFLTVRLKRTIDTKEIVGSLENYGSGRIEVHYPVSFAKRPQLEFYVLNDFGKKDPPKLIEQRTDGFVIELEFSRTNFGWKARGLVQEAL